VSITYRCFNIYIGPVLTSMDYSLPYKIGSKVSVKEYNKFLEREESSGYKYKRENNGDVHIVDMNMEKLFHFNVPTIMLFKDRTTVQRILQPTNQEKLAKNDYAISSCKIDKN
jgi:hypothetical protein